MDYIPVKTAINKSASIYALDICIIIQAVLSPSGKK